MYYYLRGILALCFENTAVIDCSGVGYRLTVSATTIGALAGKLDKEVKLYTYLAVREDAVDLYGFYSEEELSAYKMLIGVSGIGPKAAISVLSSLPPEKLAAAIVSGDAKLISRAPGIGAKTAARIILELKDKIAKEIDSSEPAAPKGKADIPVGKGNLSDALAALMVLGYSRIEASGALNGLDPALDCETLIREALKKLFSPR